MPPRAEPRPTQLIVSAAMCLERLRTRIGDNALNFSVRTTNSLEDAELEYVGQLIQLTEDELYLLRNFNEANLNQVRDRMEEWGFEIGTRLPTILAELFPIGAETKTYLQKQKVETEIISKRLAKQQIQQQQEDRRRREKDKRRRSHR